MPEGPSLRHAAADTACPSHPWCAVLGVTLAVFTVTVTEMLPAGLIPQMADDLRVSGGAAGLTITVYGVVAGLTAPAATQWTHRMDRRNLLLAILGVLIVGNLMAGLVTSYPQLLAIRLVMGFAHGLMWSITATIAVRLVPPSSAATATAIAFSGISLALVLGVPGGTFMGAWIGWRSAFLAVVALAAVAWTAVLIVVPRLPQTQTRRPGQWRTLLSRRRGIQTILVITVLAVVANYAAYTYLAPFLIHRLDMTEAAVSVYLLVYGVAGVIGNVVAGALMAYTSAVRILLCSFLGAASVSILFLVFSRQSGWATGLLIAIWGLSYSALPVLLQTAILQRAPDAREAATSIYVMAFNMSIAAGALGGALAIDQISTAAPLMLGALLCMSATVATRYVHVG